MLEVFFVVNLSISFNFIKLAYASWKTKYFQVLNKHVDRMTPNNNQ